MAVQSEDYLTQITAQHQNEIEARDEANLPMSIAMIDQHASELCEEGRGLEAIPYYERSLLLRRDRFGLHSNQVATVCKRLVLLYNSWAMKALREAGYGQALEMLEKAEILTESRGGITEKTTRLRLRAVTLNNFGCYYKE